MSGSDLKDGAAESVARLTAFLQWVRSGGRGRRRQGIPDGFGESVRRSGCISASSSGGGSKPAECSLERAADGMSAQTWRSDFRILVCLLERSCSERSGEGGGAEPPLRRQPRGGEPGEADADGASVHAQERSFLEGPRPWAGALGNRGGVLPKLVHPDPGLLAPLAYMVGALGHDCLSRTSAGREGKRNLSRLARA